MNSAPLRSAADCVRRDGAALGLDEALGDGQAQAGAGAPPVAGVGAVELVEQPVERLGRNARPLVAHDDLDPRRRPRRASTSMRPPAGEYFAALSSRLNSACSASTKSSDSGGRSGGDARGDGVVLAAAAPRGAAPSTRGRRRRPPRAWARSRRHRAGSCRAGCRRSGRAARPRSAPCPAARRASARRSGRRSS